MHADVKREVRRLNRLLDKKNKMGSDYPMELDEINKKIETQKQRVELMKNQYNINQN